MKKISHIPLATTLAILIAALVIGSCGSPAPVTVVDTDVVRPPVTERLPSKVSGNIQRVDESSGDTTGVRNAQVELRDLDNNLLTNDRSDIGGGFELESVELTSDNGYYIIVRIAGSMIRIPYTHNREHLADLNITIGDETRVDIKDRRLEVQVTPTRNPGDIIIN